MEYAVVEAAKANNVVILGGNIGFRKIAQVPSTILLSIFIYPSGGSGQDRNSTPQTERARIAHHSGTNPMVTSTLAYCQATTGVHDCRITSE